MRRYVAMFAAFILTGTVTAALALTVPLESSQVSRTYEPMSLSQWHSQRALDVHEDDVFGRWNCKINGNAQCGTWQYELICVAGHTDCTLEGVDLRTLRD